MSDIIGVAEHIFGEAAIHGIARVLLFLTERFPATEAMLAMSAGGIEPGYADAVALLDVPDAHADGDDVSYTLVTRDEGRLRLDRPVALNGMEVRVADARRRDLNKNLPGPTVGTGTSSIISGLPNSRTTAAFMVFAIRTSYVDRTVLIELTFPRCPEQLGVGSACWALSDNLFRAQAVPKAAGPEIARSAGLELAVFFPLRRTSPPVLALSDPSRPHARAGGVRSRPMSHSTSANSRRGTATSPIWKVT